MTEAGTHRLNSPEDWWKIAMGSGYRGALAQLDTELFHCVREENISSLQANRVTAIETNVIYAVATKG